MDSERESELEKALLGIPFSGNLEFTYSGKLNTKDKITYSPSYVLPIGSHNNISYGYFLLDGKLAEARVGILRRRNFLSKEYFRFDFNGNLLKEPFREKKIYLPVKLIDLVLTIGIEEKDGFNGFEGSPFSAFGLEGPHGIYPILFIAENEEEILCKGLYKTKDGGIATYDHGLSYGRDFENFFKSIKKPKSSTDRVLKATARSGTFTSKDSTKPLELITNEDIKWDEPKSIVSYLDQHVIGQNDAKMTVAVAFSNYMTKVITQSDDLYKDNVILIGPSGVGKTYMISLLAKKADLPIVQTKLTGKSSEGYKGENLSSIWEQMRAMTDEEAPYGIVFLDEIDKLARDEFGSENGFGSRLQDELIGWLEEANVSGHDSSAYSGLNTKNVLFVTAGAFHGPNDEYSLAGIIKKRLNKSQRKIGFGTSQEADNKDDSILHKVRPEDLINYGLKPELVGRFPSLGVLDRLVLEDKVNILIRTEKSPILNYSQILRLKGYQVVIDSSVLEIIARQCPEETGARALNAICNDLFTEILFDPKKYADRDNVINITTDLARKLINLYI